MTEEGEDVLDRVGLVRVRLDLAYDGTEFSGWAAQPGRRTVQGVVEEALHRILRLPEPPRLTVAGRTDAGVHARGQVAHLDIDTRAWAGVADTAVRRMPGLLPPDIRMHAMTEAPAGFDARFGALWRRYSYRVSDAPGGGDPLRRNETLWHRHPLAVERMNAAAQHCLGEHDFAAFCRRREGATTVRQLLRLDWERDAEGVAVATVVADAFCHNMVRALMGALLAVGAGDRPEEWPGEVLAAATRDPSVHVASPHGLCLEEVRYPPAAQLGKRASETRRLRTVSARG
jgi:tRNA pseudouridine38-40 synthase